MTTKKTPKTRSKNEKNNTKAEKSGVINEKNGVANEKNGVANEKKGAVNEKKGKSGHRKTAVRPKAVKSHPKYTKDTLKAYSRKQLEKTLKIDAKALGIPIGSAEIFIEKTLDAVEKSLGPKKIITDRDLTSAIAKELKKYHADFAYIYRNRDKIV